MTDFSITVAQHRNPGIEAANQFDIAVDIDFTPVKRLLLARKSHQRFAHGIAQVALFAIVEN